MLGVVDSSPPPLSCSHDTGENTTANMSYYCVRGKHSSRTPSVMSSTASSSGAPSLLSAEVERSLATRAKKERRQKWRESTAPLTAEDYRRVLDNLQSSSEEEGNATGRRERLEERPELNSGCATPSSSRSYVVGKKAKRRDPQSTSCVFSISFDDDRKLNQSSADTQCTEADVDADVLTQGVSVYSLIPRKGHGGASLPISTDDVPLEMLLSSQSPDRSRRHRMLLEESQKYYRVYSPERPPIIEAVVSEDACIGRGDVVVASNENDSNADVVWDGRSEVLGSVAAEGTMSKDESLQNSNAVEDGTSQLPLSLVIPPCRGDTPVASSDVSPAHALRTRCPSQILSSTDASPLGVAHRHTVVESDSAPAVDRLYDALEHQFLSLREAPPPPLATIPPRPTMFPPSTTQLNSTGTASSVSEGCPVPESLLSSKQNEFCDAIESVMPSVSAGERQSAMEHGAEARYEARQGRPSVRPTPLQLPHGHQRGSDAPSHTTVPLIELSVESAPIGSDMQTETVVVPPPPLEPGLILEAHDDVVSSSPHSSNEETVIVVSASPNRSPPVPVATNKSPPPIVTSSLLLATPNRSPQKRSGGVSPFFTAVPHSARLSDVPRIHMSLDDLSGGSAEMSATNSPPESSHPLPTSGNTAANAEFGMSFSNDAAFKAPLPTFPPLSFPHGREPSSPTHSAVLGHHQNHHSLRPEMSTTMGNNSMSNFVLENVRPVVSSWGGGGVGSVRQEEFLRPLEVPPILRLNGTPITPSSALIPKRQHSFGSDACTPVHVVDEAVVSGAELTPTAIEHPADGGSPLYFKPPSEFDTPTVVPPATTTTAPAVTPHPVDGDVHHTVEALQGQSPSFGRSRPLPPALLPSTMGKTLAPPPSAPVHVAVELPLDSPSPSQRSRPLPPSVVPFVQTPPLLIASPSVGATLSTNESVDDNNVNPAGLRHANIARPLPPSLTPQKAVLPPVFEAVAAIRNSSVTEVQPVPTTSMASVLRSDATNRPIDLEVVNPSDATRREGVSSCSPPQSTLTSKSEVNQPGASEERASLTQADEFDVDLDIAASSSSKRPPRRSPSIPSRSDHPDQATASDISGVPRVTQRPLPAAALETVAEKIQTVPPSHPPNVVGNMNLVRRAKVANIFDAFSEYNAACESYLKSLKACSSKLPHAANDAVRDVLAFAISFTKASQKLAIRVKERKMALPASSQWLTVDVETDDTAYERLLTIIDEEIAVVERQRDNLSEQVVQFNSAEKIARMVFDSPRGESLVAPQPSATSLSKVSVTMFCTALQQAAASLFRPALSAVQKTLKSCREIEVAVSLACDLQRIYSMAFLSHDAAENLFLAAAKKLKKRNESELELSSAFGDPTAGISSLLADNSQVTEGDLTEGECKRMRNKLIDNAWGLRELLVDYVETGVELSASPPRSSQLDRGPLANRFPFVVQATSQIHLRAPSSDEEALQLVKLCAESHRYCAQSRDNFSSFVSNSEFKAIASVAEEIAGRMELLIGQYADGVEKLFHVVQEVVCLHRFLKHVIIDDQELASEFLGMLQRQVTSKEGGNKLIFSHAVDATATQCRFDRVILEMLSVRAAKAQEQFQTVDRFLLKRRHMRELLAEEITMVRTLDQVPFDFDDNVLLWSGTKGIDAVKEDPTASANERLERVGLTVDTNRRLSKANFLLLGNCLLKNVDKAATSISSETQRCMESLGGVREAQEVVAAAIRRTMAIVKKSPSGSDLRPTAAPPALVHVFGSSSRPLKQATATSFLTKVKLLRNAGAIAFVPNALRLTPNNAVSSPEIARCILKLSDNFLTLECTSLRPAAGADLAVGDVDHSIEFSPVAPIDLTKVEMLLQGPSVPFGPVAGGTLQAMKVISAEGEKELLFPSFGSFTEWSETLQILSMNLRAVKDPLMAVKEMRKLL